MRWSLVLALTASIVTSSCGSGTNPSGSGTLRMMLKDGPFSDAKALLVTFSEVDVHKSDTVDDAWIKIAGEKTCDLKRLETAQTVLGSQPLGSGHYTQVRLVVTSAVVYFDGESTVVETFVSSLRKKVEGPDARLIHTVRGVGYRLQAADA